MNNNTKGLLNLYGFRPKKKWGQNFLVDEKIADRIVKNSSISSEDLVIEIGPGAGVLTKFLAKSANKVIAVEIDRQLCGILSEQLKQFKNVEIVQKDFLKFDIKDIAKKNNTKVKIVGNLPFYITSPIISGCLNQKDFIKTLIFGIQKEVADRLLAKPGNKTYGSLTCYASYFADVSILHKISKSVFWPQPKVDAAMIKMDIRNKPAVFVKDEKLFFKLIRSAFNQRRKTILNSLQKAGVKKDELVLILNKADIEPIRRAETLSLEEFAAITNSWG